MIGIGLYQFWRNMGKVGYVSVFRLWWCGWCWGRLVGGLDQGLGGWDGVMYVYVVSLDSLCIWQVQVSVYCARRIPAHLRCTQCSIMLHPIDICFLTCICMWQISQIQTCLRVVVGSGLVSTSPAFMRSIASHPACLHGRLAPKIGYRAAIAGGGMGRHNLHRVCQTAVTAPPRVECVVWSPDAIGIGIPVSANRSRDWR